MTVESDTPETESASPVDRIAAILASREDKPAPKAQRDEVAEEDDEESPEPGDEEPEESEQDEDEATEDDDQDEQPETAKLEEIEINGKKVKLPADVAAEIKAGTLRQQDYTRKTQEAAELRKAAEAERQTAQTQLREYEQGLKVVEHALMASLPPEVTLDYLHEHGSEAYIAAQAARAQHIQKLQAVAGEVQRVESVRQKQAEAESARYRAEQARRVTELIPSWKDEKSAAADQKLIKDSLKAIGFDDADIGHISMNGSAEHIRILQEWATFKRLMSAKKAATPTAPKVAAPGPARIPQDQSRVAKARQALKRTGGKDGSAAFLIGHLLEKRGIK